MAFNTASGAKISIGTTTAASTITEYEGDTYDQVGTIEDLGEFGDAYNAVTFTSLSDSRVKKRKGSADAGEMNLTVAFDSGDDGQQALKDALDDTGGVGYNFKVELNDSQGVSPTTFYFKALVMSRRIQVGSADNVVRANVTLGIDTEILEEAAA